MKRTIAFLMAFLVLLTASVVFAEESEEEIIWQDIPWSCNKNYVLKIMQKNKWISSANSDTKFFSAEQASNFGMGFPAYIQAESGLNDPFLGWNTNLVKKEINVLLTIKKPNLSVAGYPVDKIECTFGPGEKLMTIGLLFQNQNDVNATIENLITEMETAYGEMHAVNGNYEGFIHLGGNNTAVLLTKQYAYTPKDVYLTFGKTTWNEVFGIDQ